jgi:putative ABC transport system permease protein
MKLHTNDIEMLKNKVPGIKYISPQNSLSSLWQTRTISTQRKKGNYGITGDYPIGDAISKKKLTFGRYINDADISGNKNVVVIGNEVYESFFDAKRETLLVKQSQ